MEEKEVDVWGFRMKAVSIPKIFHNDTVYTTGLVSTSPEKKITDPLALPN